MRLATFTMGCCALALLSAASPTFSQTAPTAQPAVPTGAPAAVITPGMQVFDEAGAPVGTVTALKGDTVSIKTDKHETFVPKASFGFRGGKLVFVMTQAQLNAEIEKTQAASDSAIVVGATVKGLAGTQIGKIESVTDSAVQIVLTSGQKIQVARNGVRGNADRTVTAGVHEDQLEAQLKAKPAATKK